MGRGAYSFEFVRYGFLRRDVTYGSTDLPKSRWSLLASSSLVGMYRPLEARSVSCIRYREYVGGTVQK